MKESKKDFLSLQSFSKAELLEMIRMGLRVKDAPESYSEECTDKTLLLIFQAPSLRTRLSFEQAMLQMNGETIYYPLDQSPWGKGKESIEDVGKVISRYVNVVMARIFSHEDLVKLAEYATIPVINGLTNGGHPCQVLGDLMTITEKKEKLDRLQLTYVGDCNNNLTFSLLEACPIVGMDVVLGCPQGKEFKVPEKLWSQALQTARKNGTKMEMHHDAAAAIRNADVVYTDSWMSYRVPESERARRVKILKPFQVNEKLMQRAAKDAIFMHCLPALRGNEVTPGVIDGRWSVVFDQAENRMHIQKAILLKLLGKY
ncbi:ornithine carbamoyltransferase [Candidatus Woesearchaeota archaeon]|nr:ornithine carbamoyltransferase [Candidatus Woesearchaeota archaeon]